MPRIVTYDAGDRRLTPDQRGNEAFTRAGRYVGQYYRQISGDQAAEGQIQAQGIKGRAWPFDVLALEGRQLQDAEAAAASARSSAGNQPGGVKFAGEEKLPQTPSAPTYTALDPETELPVGGAYATHGQTSRGAAALGNYAAGTGSAGLPRQDSVIDPTTGQDLNRLTAAQVQANKLASAKNALSYEKDRARLGGGIGNGASTGANGQAAAAANASPADPNPNGTFSSMPMDQYGNPIPTPIPGGSPPASDYNAQPTGTPGQFDAVPVAPDAKAIRDWSAPPGADPSI